MDRDRGRRDGQGLFWPISTAVVVIKIDVIVDVKERNLNLLVRLLEETRESGSATGENVLDENAKKRFAAKAHYDKE